MRQIHISNLHLHFSEAQGMWYPDLELQGKAAQTDIWKIDIEPSQDIDEYSKQEVAKQGEGGEPLRKSQW